MGFLDAFKGAAKLFQAEKPAENSEGELKAGRNLLAEQVALDRLGNRIGNKISYVKQRREDVQDAQELLKGLAIKLGDETLDPGGIDGIMGPKTKAAIKAFQSFSNLVVDGKLGRNTLVAIKESFSGDHKQKEAPKAKMEAVQGEKFDWQKNPTNWRTKKPKKKKKGSFSHFGKRQVLDITDPNYHRKKAARDRRG
ncbi:peptidoglycan-binding protein [Candidatus Peregrinibacteria bacterium]|jgi:peptidoglycan hydrolase-like protein with peptidoglycan-binding domain|nr:peptidoglycan-binding protein [Candidatus Peregrinibacteria bacterium]MBT4056041.1 peptidoglycan-binding protein [Candidatus Peregrinibacteria bacterium]